MIGYYVHHQGTGHLHRAASIASELCVPVVGLSSRPAPAGWDGPWVRLDADDDGVDRDSADVTAGATLHWVPRHHEGLRRRMGAISALLTTGRLDTVVCDVSVEVALLARLHGIPVVVMAQPGDRTDRAHRLAYDQADRLLAPWPADPARGWDPAWAAKTVHLGGFSRYDRREITPGGGGRRALVVWGTGGVDVSPEAIEAAACATPDWQWKVAGRRPPDRALLRTTPPERTAPPNLEEIGWVEDLWPALCAADVVVTHAGQNAVAEVAAARRPAIVIPQVRPFDEQRATADALRRSGLATVLDSWARPDQWPELLASTACRPGSDWCRWSDGAGAQRAARAIEAQLTPGSKQPMIEAAR